MQKALAERQKQIDEALRQKEARRAEKEAKKEAKQAKKAKRAEAMAPYKNGRCSAKNATFCLVGVLHGSVKYCPRIHDEERDDPALLQQFKDEYNACMPHHKPKHKGTILL
jgi:hypothetical protein